MTTLLIIAGGFTFFVAGYFLCWILCRIKLENFLFNLVHKCNTSSGYSAEKITLNNIINQFKEHFEIGGYDD